MTLTRSLDPAASDSIACALALIYATSMKTLPAFHASMRILLTLLIGAATASATSKTLAFDCPWVEVNDIATMQPGGTIYGPRQIAMQVRTDGRPLLAYTGGPRNSQSLRIVDCLDAQCNEKVDTLLASSTFYDHGLGFALTADGRPLLLTTAASGLTYYECGDAQCELYRTVEVTKESFSYVRAITVRPDGRPMIVYSHETQAGIPTPVFVLSCSDTRCLNGVPRKIMEIHPDGWFSFATAANDADGRLALTYRQNDEPGLLSHIGLLRCLDPECETTQAHIVSSPVADSYPTRTSMAMLADGRPLVLDGQTSSPDAASWSALIECVDPLCNERVTNPLFTGNGIRY